MALDMMHSGNPFLSLLKGHLEKHGDDFSVMEELGLVLAAQGHPKQAIEVYQKGLGEFPNHPGVPGEP